MPHASAARSPAAEGVSAEAPLDAEILSVVRERRGVDFREYRPATIARRIHDRMPAARAPTVEAYLDRLRREPAEADRLVERLTIEVSRFFRGASAVEAVPIA